MAQIAFVAPPFLGHLNPMLALAAELERRGHRATFLHMADVARFVETRGLAFRPLGASSHPAGFLAEMNRGIGRLNGPFGVRRTVSRVAGITEMLCRELPAALRAIGADLIVCDQVEAAGGLAAMHLGLPHVSLASALPINWEAAVPPIFTPWRPHAAPWALTRNRVGHRATAYLMRPIGSVVIEYADRWNLGPRRRVDHALSAYLQIAQTVAGLEFPRQKLPPVFHYVGPIRAPSPPGLALPRDGRPLAYASLGSLQGGRFSVFRRFAEAAERAGMQLVLTHAGGLSEAQVARLPGKPLAYDFLPQGPVLREASVAILHGGLNTVLDACAAGVPLVVVPIAFEQGAIAVRVEHAGAGIGLPRWRLSANALAAAVARVRDEPAFRAASVRLREEIARAGGVARAADLTETLLRTGQPVLA
ncbi:nucleotide disphospho-sugar-binding domain-containing protein [Methylorubrum sp. SB2]|uniref:nucleotide disphospho-sugar-binding domain-containing protein n=1 Tax=Methylorubrum subtropicum TaxID=3138812 RepID=UPI00313ED253